MTFEPGPLLDSLGLEENSWLHRKDKALLFCPALEAPWPWQSGFVFGEKR